MKMCHSVMLVALGIVAPSLKNGMGMVCETQS